MYLFYSTMILLGVSCIGLSIFLLLIDRRKVQDLFSNLDNKKEDILEVINDAEQIVVEMNNFSDYLFEKIDLKTKEFEDIISEAQRKIFEHKKEMIKLDEMRKERTIDETVKEKETLAKSQMTEETVAEETVAEETVTEETVTEETVTEAPLAKGAKRGKKSKKAKNNNIRTKRENSDVKNFSTEVNQKEAKMELGIEGTQFGISERISSDEDKIFLVNPKYKNVYDLHEKGYNEVEIARMLNRGLGEIKLILGVKC